MINIIAGIVFLIWGIGFAIYSHIKWREPFNNATFVILMCGIIHIVFGHRIMMEEG